MVQEEVRVIVIARVSLRPGTKPDFLAAAQECIAATRKEEGCLSYSAYEDVTNPDGVIFVEEWQDEAAVARHMAEAHTQKLLAAAPQWISAPPSIKMHALAETTTLA